MTRPPLIPDLNHFRRRLVADALTEATGNYWERRARTFEWATPRPGDYTGGASIFELAERMARCQAAAEACRQHSKLLRHDAPWWLDELVDDNLDQLAQEVA